MLSSPHRKFAITEHITLPQAVSFGLVSCKSISFARCPIRHRDYIQRAPSTQARQPRHAGASVKMRPMARIGLDLHQSPDQRGFRSSLASDGKKIVNIGSVLFIVLLSQLSDCIENISCNFKVKQRSFVSVWIDYGLNRLNGGLNRLQRIHRNRYLILINYLEI